MIDDLFCEDHLLQHSHPGGCVICQLGRHVEEIARLKLELAKTADLREAWLEAQKSTEIARLTTALAQARAALERLANACGWHPDWVREALTPPPAEEGEENA
jgi:hypothetical protein